MEAQIAQVFSSIFETMKKDIVAQVEKDFEAKLAKIKAEIKEEIKAEIFGEFEIKVDARLVKKVVEPVVQEAKEEIAKVIEPIAQEEENEEVIEPMDEVMLSESYEFRGGEWNKLEANEKAMSVYQEWYDMICCTKFGDTFKHEKHAYNWLCKHEEFIKIVVHPNKGLITAQRDDVI